MSTKYVSPTLRDPEGTRLVAPDRTPEPLPGHLQAMLKRAVRGELEDLTTEGLNTPKGTNFYTLAWGCSYFISGDTAHALSRLEHVHSLLKGSTAIGRATEEEDEKPETVYEIPPGARSKTCSCGVRIWFVKTETGASMPVTEFGLSHYLDCPNAKKRSRSRKKAP